MQNTICKKSDSSPNWSFIDLFIWKLVPERFGGGIQYIQSFKDTWVNHHKLQIITCARAQQFPPALLAGVCWIEVGGDPTIIDRFAFAVRSFDWSGPDWIDRHLTITKAPSLTSFGPVSMQLRTAAQTLGINPKTMSTEQLRALAQCLEKDSFNISIVAKHLRQIIDHDNLQQTPPDLDMESVKIVGARFNRGMGLSLGQIKKNTSYGNFIVKHWSRFEHLLKASIRF